MYRKAADLAVIFFFISLLVVPFVHSMWDGRDRVPPGEPRADGAARDPEGVDPSRVLSLADLTRRYRMAINVLDYRLADARGWPADPAHRKFVRLIQDQGIPVAFGQDGEAGDYFVAVGYRDIDLVTALADEAQKLGLAKLPAGKPAGRLIAEGEVDGVSFSLREGAPDSPREKK